MPVELVMIKNLATGSEVRVSANPSSIRIEHTVPWERHKQSRGDNPTLEFDSQGPSILTCELTFRGVGTPPNVYREFVEPLTAMTLVARDAPAEQRHPPQCLFVRGAEFPSFKGVIESLATTYVEFADDGAPLKAICELRMREAGILRARVRRRRAPA